MLLNKKVKESYFWLAHMYTERTEENKEIDEMKTLLNF